MNAKDLHEAKAERAATWVAALAAAEIRESLPADLESVEGYDRDVAWDDIWGHVCATDRGGLAEPLPAELEPYAAKLRRVRERLMGALKTSIWDGVYFDWSDMASNPPRVIVEARESELAVYDEAIRARLLLDGLEKRYGPSRYAEQDVESFLLEQLDDKRQTLAKLRRARELELAKWDVAIDLFEGREALRKRNGRRYEDNDQASTLANLLTEE